MRRFFGSKVVDSAEASSKKGARGSRRGAHASSTVMSRYHLVKPPDSWVHIMRSNQGGVDMEAVPEEDLLRRKPTTFREEKWWTFTHSQSYKKAELRFLSAVAVGGNVYCTEPPSPTRLLRYARQIRTPLRRSCEKVHGTSILCCNSAKSLGNKKVS